jgi:hypothetical protein
VSPTQVHGIGITTIIDDGTGHPVSSNSNINFPNGVDISQINQLINSSLGNMNMYNSSGNVDNRGLYSHQNNLGNNTNQDGQPPQNQSQSQFINAGNLPNQSQNNVVGEMVMNEIVVDSPLNIGDLTNQLLAQMGTQLGVRGNTETEDIWEDINEEEDEQIYREMGDNINTNIGEKDNTIGGETFYDTKSETNKTDIEEKNITEEKQHLENNDHQNTENQ